MLQNESFPYLFNEGQWLNIESSETAHVLYASLTIHYSIELIPQLNDNFAVTMMYSVIITAIKKSVVIIRCEFEYIHWSFYVVTRPKSMKGQFFSGNCTCITDTPPRIVKWWKLCRASIRLAGPTAQPVFQPVTLNVFPALPMLMVLSAIPSNVAKRQNFVVYRFYRLMKIQIVWVFLLSFFSITSALFSSPFSCFNELCQQNILHLKPNLMLILKTV